MAFVTLCSSELIRAFTARSKYHSVISIGVFSNRWMVWAVGVSFLLALMAVYVPFLRPFFDTVPLTAGDWLFMLSFFYASPVAMELLKVFFRNLPARTMETVQAPVSGAPVAGFAQQGASLASISQQFAGGNTMLKVLIPVDGSRDCQFAVKHVLERHGDPGGNLADRRVLRQVGRTECACRIRFRCGCSSCPGSVPGCW